MKTASEYVGEAVTANAYWECTGAGVPLIEGTCTKDAAIAAVQQALDDSAKYYTLLMAAIRRSKPQPETA